MNIAICDDEDRSLRDIYSKLLNIDSRLVIDTFYSGKKLLLSKKKYDIVILDIDMEELDGMKTAELLRQEKRTEYLIFLTGHSEFMQDAFKVKAFRYLIKPADPEELKESLISISEENMDNVSFIVKDSGSSISISLNDIICFEAFGDGTYIYTADKVYTSSSPLKKWIEDIKNYNFFQVHKSYVISFNHTVKICKYEAEMANLKIKVPISQRKYTKMKAAFFEYVKKKAIHM
ncbi:MAG: response regulator transcription factor [Ruminococcus sp.]|nr:response regulator transcription factor [Ruminococcus sp.]